MKLYEITITPLSGFGTPLKGDTLFGRFCWETAYDPTLLKKKLNDLIASYPEKPFVIFSSAFPTQEKEPRRYFFKRPDLPLRYLASIKEENRRDRILEEKKHRKMKWMEIRGDAGVIHPLKANYRTDAEIIAGVDSGPEKRGAKKMGRPEDHALERTFSQPHNSINRLSQTTGKPPFAPYSLKVIHYHPGTTLAIFILVDETAADIEDIARAMERIGAWGFGRDSSIGNGRFKTGEPRSIPLPDRAEANACYALAPSIPGPDRYKQTWFKTFVRYGKHGDVLARSGNPFKNPVIMADEGAVCIPRDPGVFDKPYLGAAVKGVSKAMPETVVQGYAPYLPMKLEQPDETDSE